MKRKARERQGKRTKIAKAWERPVVDFFAQAQIGQLNVSPPVQQEIIRFQVTVKVTHSMHSLHSQYSLSGVKLYTGGS